MRGIGIPVSGGVRREAGGVPGPVCARWPRHLDRTPRGRAIRLFDIVKSAKVKVPP